MTKDFKITICDMGISKIKRAAEATVTSFGKGPGTFPYMAPEMFHKGRRGKAVDIYSFGCTLIELFSDHRVWPNLDATEIMMRICGSFQERPRMPDIDDLQPPYQAICNACCQLDAASRPSIDAILILIEQL